MLKAKCAKGGYEKMKRYLLKEYGAWGVMLMAYAAGLVASGRFGMKALAALFALALLINSKQSFTVWMRSAAAAKAAPRAVFLAQTVIAATILTAVAGDKILQLMPYAVIPLSYLLCLKLLGEHALITEVTGFVLLALSSLIGRFAASGEIDPRLFFAVAVFFTAGVFKVRIQLRKTMRYRMLMAAYLIASSVLYIAAGLPLLLLVPLVENLVFAATLYRAGLRTTGWVEVAKGLVFLVLLAFSYV
jgi:hypothetical protein